MPIKNIDTALQLRCSRLSLSMSSPNNSLPEVAGNRAPDAIRRFQLEESVIVRRWRPASFSKLASTSLVFVTIGFLAGIITLQFKDKDMGGITFAAEATNFSSMQDFGIQYLPTILIVAFGMWISIVDLDIKRLDPWCRLSVDPNSSALFCRYDSEFALTVVYKAIRAR